jgi:putative ABC transport system permease protein
VLDTIDSMGTRTVTITAPTSASISSEIVWRLKEVDGVTWVGAFGPARDVENVNRPNGEPVAARQMWSTDFRTVGISHLEYQVSWASDRASDELGFAQGSGAVSSFDGTSTDVRCTISPPAFLRNLEPMVIEPTSRQTLGIATIIVAVASTPSQVSALTDTVVSAAAVDDPSRLKVQSSEDLVRLRQALDTTLGTYGKEITGASLAATVVIVGSMLIGQVIVRRRDFGRRRALGANRTFIVLLVVSQSLLTAIVGAASGASTAVAALMTANRPTPPLDLSLAVCVLIVMSAALASLPPALIAANRDPASELRVP